MLLGLQSVVIFPKQTVDSSLHPKMETVFTRKITFLQAGVCNPGDFYQKITQKSPNLTYGVITLGDFSLFLGLQVA